MKKIKERYEEFGKISEKTISATELIKTFCQDFDADLLSASVAKKELVSQEEILSQWELKREIGCDWGNALHKTLELWIKYNLSPKNTLMIGFQEEFKRIFPKTKKFFSEKKFYVKDYDLVFTADLLEEVKKNSFVIYDLKNYSEYYDNKYFFKYPLNTLKENNFNKTYFQLLIIKLGLEKLGYKVKGLKIITQNLTKIDIKNIPENKILESKIKEILIKKKWQKKI